MIEEERRLKELNQYCNAFMQGCKVMKHLTKTYPIAIQVEGGIIVVSEETITLKRMFYKNVTT